MNKPSIVLVIYLSLLACSEVEESLIPTVQVSKSEVQFNIKTQGELEATNATPITAASQSMRPLTIAWIEKNYTHVKKGDVIVKFDGQSLEQEVETAEFEIEKLMLTKLQKQREMGLFLDDFKNEGQVVDFEYEMAQQFNIDNPLLYTKIEMIEAGNNEDFLQEKTKHLKKMESHYQTKSESEIGLIQSQEKVQQAKLSMNQVGLSALDVKAPHDGLLVLAKGWDGSLPQTGKSIFPGMKIAKLPDLSTMQAKLYVPEIEAIGLEKGQKVKVSLHAYPSLVFNATIKSVSKTAQTKQRDNPVKYFIVTAEIEEKDEGKLIPSQRLDATIFTSDKSNNLSLPIQAVFRKGQETWVYLQSSNGSTFTKKTVQTGQCSTSLCLIKSGIKEGDTIALTKPFEEKI